MSELSLMLGGRCRLVILLQVVVLVIAMMHLCAASEYQNYQFRTKTPTILRVSTIMSPALAVKTGRGYRPEDFTGFIPQLLWELKEREGIHKNYEIVPAWPNEIGHKADNGNWTALMGDVLASTHERPCIGAGPILDVGNHTTQVMLSKPWVTVELRLVVRRTSNVTSLQQALDSGFCPYIVRESAEYAQLMKFINTTKPAVLVRLWDRLHETQYHERKFVDSVWHGLDRVQRDERAFFIVNSIDALYHTTHDHCNLISVGNIGQLGNYTFAIQRNNLVSESINNALRKMRDDGSLERLMNQHLGILGACRGTPLLTTGPTAALILAALFTTCAKILS